MRGRIIAIEGTDGSGKETQSKLLEKRLVERGYRVMRISFPRYEDEASILLRRYLSGTYGEHPEDTDSYSASVFYAVDRADAFRQELGAFYRDGGILITDRYTTSNMIHQAAKIDDPEERERFFSWLEDFEYRKLKIPKPDLVLFLDMPQEASQKLLAVREGEGLGAGDIHEADRAYLEKSKERAREIASSRSWEQISCVEDGEILSIETIAKRIEKVVDASGVLHV